MGLLSHQNFGSSKIFEILMICDNVNRNRGSFKVVTVVTPS